ncbi:MAG: ABC transporter permease subunit [Coriobacteriia bacterium]|nr:ABC transporter permease subunit [Coriobacteriia bacterium]
MLSQVWSTLTTQPDFYLSLLLQHLSISLLAILMASLIGLVIGILIAEFKKTSGLALALINIVYTIPSISLLGLLIPLSGIGNTTAIIALTIYALLPMVRNTFTGIDTIDPRIIEAARGMGSTESQILTKIKLPLALPVIVAGFRNMVVMTVALAGIASFIGAGGLGVAIYRGITTNNMAMTIAGSLLIALLAFLMDFIVGAISRLIESRKVILRRLGAIALVALLAASVAVVVISTLSNRTSGDDIIHIATKPMTEQYIIGEMLTAVIEDRTDLKVVMTQGVGGGTSNIHPAMVAGEFDLYPEYTGTGWNEVLKKTGIYNETLFDELQSEYNDRFNMQWLGMYGFNNTYGLAIRTELAEQYNVRTYSDLARVAPLLNFGAEYDFFEREDGYKALCETYGLTFRSTTDLDIGLKYKAIAQGQVDVINIFTTDGQLSSSGVTVLEDDQSFYPSYRCGNVVRNEVLERYPQLGDALMVLDDVIDDATMAQLNYEVEEEGAEPKDVALRFLRERGLLE